MSEYAQSTSPALNPKSQDPRSLWSPYSRLGTPIDANGFRTCFAIGLMGLRGLLEDPVPLGCWGPLYFFCPLTRRLRVSLVLRKAGILLLGLLRMT